MGVSIPVEKACRFGSVYLPHTIRLLVAHSPSEHPQQGLSSRRNGTDALPSQQNEPVKEAPSV